MWRIWDISKGVVAFIGLNPSTADESEDDPTIRRCINFAKSWGYGGIEMLNLFAFRATKPVDLFKSMAPIGPDNDFYLKAKTAEAAITIAAWGNGGNFKNREKDVLKLLDNLYCLSITKSGQPGHPLFLKGDLRPRGFPRST